jgi:hypothetical protein
VTSVLATDPGSFQSAWLRYDGTRPQGFGITVNDILVRALRSGGLPDVVVIEKVESYGIAVGAEVFDTALWAGRFAEAAHRVPVVLLPRRAVKLALCAAETGLAESRIRMILVNPLYNGWVRRHRRSRGEVRKPAPWRADPPVSDELCARVEDVCRTKTRAGGARRADRVDLLKGLIECVCGRRVRSDGTFADGRHRKLHVDPCPEWGKRARLGDEVWEEPILAQLEAVELDEATIGAVVASLGAGPRPGRGDSSCRTRAGRRAR